MLVVLFFFITHQIRTHNKYIWRDIVFFIIILNCVLGYSVLLFFYFIEHIINSFNNCVVFVEYNHKRYQLLHLQPSNTVFIFITISLLNA